MIGPTIDRDLKFIALEPLFQVARCCVDHFQIEIRMAEPKTVHQSE